MIQPIQTGFFCFCILLVSCSRAENPKAVVTDTTGSNLQLTGTISTRDTVENKVLPLKPDFILFGAYQVDCMFDCACMYRYHVHSGILQGGCHDDKNSSCNWVMRNKVMIDSVAAILHKIPPIILNAKNDIYFSVPKDSLAYGVFFAFGIYDRVIEFRMDTEDKNQPAQVKALPDICMSFTLNSI